MNVNAPVLLFLCCCFCVLIDSFDLTWTFRDLEYNSDFFFTDCILSLCEHDCGPRSMVC